ncbi:hypothetical protein ONZ45_g7394 [Pleurotus djamor]|nr:hypothetical protein ONZ45_g7394 [Pleurotus djamor]
MELHYPLIPLPQLDAAARADNRNYMQLEMAIVHNVLLRTLSTVWNYAPLVSPKDQMSFARYCLIMVEGIETHHHNEETIIFPFLATKLSMEDNVEQHKTFQEGAQALLKKPPTPTQRRLLQCQTVVIHDTLTATPDIEMVGDITSGRSF